MLEEIDKTYKQIENKILNHEIYQNVKDYSKAKEKMRTYLEIGGLLNDMDTKYGKSIIKDYAKRLTYKFGKKYSTSLLYKIKQFYSIIEKVPTMSGKLTWSHWYEMLPIKDINKIIYYANQSEIKNLDVRQLREKIKNREYERLDEKTKQKLNDNKENAIKDFIKHPIILKNTNNYEDISERVLQQLILEDISSFLKELGNGFTFIDNEYKIKIGETYNYIDLLLFNYIYNCFVVIELKKEHIGQTEIYMNYIDKNVRTTNQNKTIGIIICKKENKFVLEYCSDERIYETTYMLIKQNKIKQVDKQTNVFV